MGNRNNEITVKKGKNIPLEHWVLFHVLTLFVSPVPGFSFD